jgi:nitrite reductase (NO-forming)/hydroxylamine reductase
MIKASYIVIVLVAVYLLYNLDQQKIQQKVTAVDQSGEGLYKQFCLSCHQPDGNGVRGMYPPLAGNPTITGPADSVITIVLKGLQGPIEVNGREYNQVMPAQDYLTDKQIADILTFIRSSWGNKAGPVKQEQVAKIRKTAKKP